MPDPDPTSPPKPPPPGFLRIVLAVFWSFFGVRKGRDLLADASIKPQHLIVAGVLGGLTLVVTLLLLVRVIIRSAGA